MPSFLFSPWLIVAIGIAAAGGAIAIQTGRLHSCQDHNAALQQQIVGLSAQIEAQNAAIAVLKAEGDRRVAAASKGAKAAREATVAARSEAQRLRDAAKAPGGAVACPAGRAVQTIRGGL